MFDSEEEREKAYIAVNSSEGKTFSSGITPPTHNIIKRKYAKTRIQKPHPVQIERSLTLKYAMCTHMNFCVFQKDVTSNVEDEMRKYATADEIIDTCESVCLGAYMPV